MHRLFWKIFILFWVVNAGVFSLGISLAHLFQSSDPKRQFPMLEAAHRAIEAHEQGQLRMFYRQTKKHQHVTTYLLNGEGELLPLGSTRQGVVPQIDNYPAFERKRRDGRVHVLRAIEVTSESAVLYRFIARYNPDRKPRPKPALILAFFLITIAATSLMVAAYITWPLRRLQEVVARFASGEHDVRVGENVASRRDVVGEVGREFNVMAERLDNTLQAQRSLLRDISHELRTPLARMQVAVALAEDNSSGAEGPLARLHIEIERLDSLIGQVLTIARLEGGENALETESFFLEPLLVSIATDAEFEFNGQEKKVSVSLDDQLKIVADLTLLRSAIENIVRNAMRHTAEGTSVEITATQKNSRLLVSIRDYGTGVPEQSLDRLFDAFYRVDTARDSNGGGHGVGLAISRGIVLAHGGSITAANHPQAGLMMSIDLPLNGAGLI